MFTVLMLICVLCGVGSSLTFFFGIQHFVGHAFEGNFYLGSIVASLVHSSSVVLLCIASLFMKDWSTWNISGKSSFSAIDYLLLVYSSGYFLADLYVVIKVKFSVLFIIHHAFILLSYFFFGIYGEGALLLVSFGFLGEVTNPMQNVCELFRQSFRMNKEKQQASAPFKYQVIRNLFRIFFILVRMLGVPLFTYVCWTQGIFSHLKQVTSFLFYYIFIGILSLLWLGSVYWSYGLLREKQSQKKQ